ncbi:hypothetical protein [Microbispora sp. H11081]|uniref:hypothetical protein n=1 Tax=Microbispora sp. H11081 TaxID=2729107 RepID=UPI00147307E5|nr:hypothetical protein [Microbispora sp. H11081]
MSEVVPLPSFGEVFFDARGQDRVLRVTWHDGTLVLSLWRGEMCTASFRMPMDDVGRLIDTLDEGFAEAGGPEQDAGTGPFPQQGAAGQEGYAPQAAYPAPPQDQAQDPYATQVHDPYATQVHDAYAADTPEGYPARVQDAYAGQPGDGYAPQDPYGTPRGAPQDPYGQARDGYAADGHASAPDAYGRARDEYAYGENGYAQADDGYGRGRRDAGFPEPAGHADHEYPDYPDYPDYPGTGQYARPPVPPPAPAPEAYPAPAALGPNDVLVARGTPPTQDRLVASSAPHLGPQTGAHAPYPSAAQQVPVDPSDPLGLGGVRHHANEAYPHEAYPNEVYGNEAYGGEPPIYTTGERLRPDQWPGGQASDPRAEHERRAGRRAAQPAPDSPIPWADDNGDGWEGSRGW